MAFHLTNLNTAENSVEGRKKIGLYFKLLRSQNYKMEPEVLYHEDVSQALVIRHDFMGVMTP